jgi:elongation factor 3
MNSLTTLLQNDDIAPRIPLLVKAIEDPSTQSLQKAIHALSQTTFVAIVTSPVLAMVTPLLERSLNTPSTSQEVTRQTVVVVENLTKLVHDPVEARAFLPKLRPGVKSVKEGASLPEVREIGQRALDVIEKAMADPDHNTESDAIARTQPSDVQKVLEKHISASGSLLDFPGDAEVLAVTKRYTSSFSASQSLLHPT